MSQYLTGPFAGWSIRGNYLVSPDGDRMTPERLVGLAWRGKMELRLAGYASRRKAEASKAIAGRRQMVKVVVVDLGDFRERHFGKSAG
ncbi:DUF3653 domain-containing protein [Stenotrophomonas sp. 364]|uniref:DUF3653 domain-containing protein n=1 Tax=Stenotrophomonas sp. 364 TaxID=2691571 RepID=UPI0013163FCE|nr:DUF3653 domain-containing protein [Stenotrophomonas sp. 364]QHB71451.1 hypothetical protein GQ674_09125 [Stenotrophomonas sp. 364]